MTLTQQVPNEGGAIYYSESWRTMIESHLPALRLRDDTGLRTIAPYNANRFDGDLMGLLTEYKYAPQYHWLIMRFNRMDSPSDYRVSMASLLIPSMSMVELLTSIHRTTMQKIK